ncbi:hypothetical protein REPUB_Repub13aG0122300 [Reevesia pubescens]
MEINTTHHVLEINLISAQRLIEPSVKRHRRMKSYAVVWVDSSTKLRTRVDCVGGENPTWNDKFLFKVSPQFLFGQSSAVSVEIYTVGIFRDKLIGNVRILISNFLPTTSPASMRIPVFSAYLIHNPSGDFFGTLNVGGMVLDDSVGFQALSKVSAIDYHGLMGENLDGTHQLRKTNKSKVIPVRDGFGDDQSEADGSLTSSPSLPDAVLRELSLKGRNEDDDHGVLPPDKETLFGEYQKEEITSVNMELPSSTNLVPLEIAEKVNSDSGGIMVKMIMEENKKLRERVEMLMLETKGQSSLISDLHGRMKSLEKKLSRRKKQRKSSNYGRRRTAFESKSDDAAEGKPTV